MCKLGWSEIRLEHDLSGPGSGGFDMSITRAVEGEWFRLLTGEFVRGRDSGIPKVPR